MVEHLSEKGKRIELLVFRYGVSTDLQSRADHIYWIDDFAQEVIQGREPTPQAVNAEIADDSDIGIEGV